MFKNICKGVPRRTLLLSLAFMVLFSLFHTGMSFAMSYVTVLWNTDKIVLFISVYALSVVMAYIVEVFADVTMDMSHYHIEGQCRLYYLKRLNNIKPEVLKKYNTGYIGSLVVKLVMRQTEVFQTMLLASINVIYITFYSIVLLVRGKYLWMICAWVLLFIGTIMRRLVFDFTQKYYKDATDKEGIRDSLFMDSATNINTVQRMQSLHFIEEIYNQKQKDCESPVLKASLLHSSSNDGMKYIGFMWAPIILWLSLSKNLSTVDLSLVIAIAIQFPHNLREVAKLSLGYTKMKTILSMLNTITCEDNIRSDLCTDVFRTAAISDLEYTYSDKRYNINPTTIRIPDFYVNRKDKVCIMGESGQGKTTLLNILSGEIETGKVFINGVNGFNRLECVFIAQDTEILDMSLRDNLLLGRNISDSKLIELLDRMGMGTWLRSQSEGLDTLLGERGVFVSTGQRQRINIIRGLLMDDKEVYLLDEPTSNVDVETEEKIIDLISEVLSDKTVIIVSHRPALASICNRHYIMSGNNTLQEYTYNVDCT